MHPIHDLTGQRFGRLTVIEHAGSYVSPDGITKMAQWRCRCDCGNETIVLRNNLHSGATRSCGCLRKDWRKQGTKVNQNSAQA